MLAKAGEHNGAFSGKRAKYFLQELIDTKNGAEMRVSI